MSTFKHMIFCMAVGFVIPTVAFAITEEPATASSPAHAPSKYLFEISYSDAEGAISFALAQKGAGQKVEATINGRKKDAVFSYSKPISVEIRGLQFDKAASRWSANLLAVAEGSVITALPVAGRFEEVIEVPVLKKQVRSGETIQASDIEIRDFPVAHTREDTISDMSSLIGKSPARVISAFRPIREREISAPAMVKKNAIVQVRFVSTGMEITTTGQALSEGARGEVIAVRNLSSKKIIRAQIEDESTVKVLSSSDAQTSQLTGATSYEAN